jgi:phytoene dehydrogenase-like protein
MLEFVFRMFAQGDIAIPADGMAAIPRQLADKLPRGTIRLQHTVETIKDGTLYLTGGQSIKPRRIVLAVESTAAAALLGDETIDTPWHQNVTHYFAAPQSPDRRKMLILAGDEYADPDNDPHAIPDRPIGTVAILSDIAPEYAPPGQALISVTSRQPATWNVSGPGLEVVREQLAQWFGPVVQQWRHLRSYSVPYGLPTLTLDQVVRSPAYGEFVLCGDYLETPSIQGALNSGVRAASLIASS